MINTILNFITGKKKELAAEQGNRAKAVSLVLYSLIFEYKKAFSNPFTRMSSFLPEKQSSHIVIIFSIIFLPPYSVGTIKSNSIEVEGDFAPHN